MDDRDLSNLRITYSDIIKGFSIGFIEKKRVYIKHFTALDQSIIDENYHSLYDKAINDGAATIEERKNQLIEQGNWTDRKEIDIENQKVYLQNLQRTKEQQYLPSQIKSISKDIKEAEIKLGAMLFEKETLFGMTAEKYANNRLNTLYVYYSFYKDNDFEIPFYDEEEFEEISKEEIQKIIQFYNDIVSKFKQINIKHIALANFFQNLFFLADDNPFTFFGKPLVELTFYQTDLFTFARYYKSIITGEAKPPQNVLDDPEALENWFIGSKNAEKVKQKLELREGHEGGGASIVGATKEDLEEMGLNKNTPPKNDKLAQLKRSGKKVIDFRELIS